MLNACSGDKANSVQGRKKQSQSEPDVSNKHSSAVNWMAIGRVALAFDLGVEELRSSSRGCVSTARARQVSMYVLHVSLGRTLAEAGAVFGRDRTTAAYACKIVEELRENPEFDSILSEIEKQLSASLASARLNRGTYHNSVRRAAYA